MRTLFALFFATLVGFFLTFSPNASASGARGTLVVSNHRDVDLLVVADGRALGLAMSGVDQAFRLSAGPHDVAIRGRQGDLVQQSRVTIGAGAVVSLLIAPANGVLELFNGAGTALTIRVDGKPTSLAAGQSRSLTLKPGEHQLLATYVQLGRERTLADQRVIVSAGGRAGVRFAPVDEGLVWVENRTGRDATLLVDGRSEGVLGNGEAMEVSTRLGRVSLILSDRGRTLAQTSLAVGAYQDLRWSASAPAFGSLMISNPLPIPVSIDDGRRTVTISARGRIELSGLPVGVLKVRASRSSGELLGQANLMVDPYDTNTWTVPAPTTGLVTLSNRGGEPLAVWIDGARVANLSPRAESTVSLNVGAHRVQVFDTRGRMMMNLNVSVDPYEPSLVVMGGGSPVAHHGHGEGDRDHGHAESHHTRP